MWLWFAIIVRPIVRFIVGIAVFGRDRLRIDEPVIIVANHNSHLDAVVLMSLLPLRVLPRVRPVAAADYFGRRLITSIVWRWCMNVLAIRRDKVTRQHNPLQAMCEALDAGDSLIIFPEGTRGEPERRSQFQTGIAHLIAKRPHVPVIPAYMRNLGFSLPRGDLVLVPLFCDVFIGKPCHPAGPRQAIMDDLARCFDELAAEAERIRPSTVPPDDR